MKNCIWTFVIILVCIGAIMWVRRQSFEMFNPSSPSNVIFTKISSMGEDYPELMMDVHVVPATKPDGSNVSGKITMMIKDANRTTHFWNITGLTKNTDEGKELYVIYGNDAVAGCSKFAAVLDIPAAEAKVQVSDIKGGAKLDIQEFISSTLCQPHK